MPQHVESPYSAGTVVVPTSGTPRYMEFYDCLDNVRVPAGTRVIKTKSADLARALNKAVDESMGEWIWFLGDDHTFPPGMLLHLLSHGLPAVCPLNIMRRPPFNPVLFKGELGPKVVAIDWADVPVGSGLWALPPDIHAGSAGLLIKRDVLAQIEKPIFRIGQLSPEILNEDFWLFKCLRDIGVPTVIDLGAPMGHLNSFAARPVVKDGKWWITFAQDGQISFAAPGDLQRD